MVPVFRVSDKHPFYGLHLWVWSSAAGGQKDKPGSGVQEHFWHHHQQQDIWENISHSFPQQDRPTCPESSSQWHTSLFPWVRVSFNAVFWGPLGYKMNLCFFRDVKSVEKYSPGFTGNPRSIEDVKKFLLSYFLSSKRYLPIFLIFDCAVIFYLIIPGSRKELSTITLPLQ